MRRVVKSKRLLVVYATCGEVSEKKARKPAGPAPHPLDQDIAAGVAQRSQLCSKPLRLLQINAAVNCVAPLAPQGEEQRAWPFQRQCELSCAGVHIVQLWRAPAAA